MAVFSRRQTPPRPVTLYLAYRPLVRDDFRECCAYCLLHEDWAAGQENFELDHFRPKSLPQFADLETDFYNLYYACHPCNHTKSNAWPDFSLEASGYGFLDFCADGFSHHFQEEANGSWTPLSRRAQYTVERLRLNRRHLVQIRSLLREIAAERGVQAVDWNLPAGEQIRELVAGPNRRGVIVNVPFSLRP